jgi:F420H(2)-dependent quinone reductase
MATALHRTLVDRLNDALITMLLRAGVKMGTASLLTVRGRKSGQPHTVPVLLVEQGGQRWLVAPYGMVQ